MVEMMAMSEILCVELQIYGKCREHIGFDMDNIFRRNSQSEDDLSSVVRFSCFPRKM